MGSQRKANHIILFVCLVAAATVVVEGMTPLVDSTGSLHRSAVATLPSSQGGIIALINPSPMFAYIREQLGSRAEDEELQGVYKAEVEDRCTLLLSPGANTIPMAQGTAGSIGGTNPVRAGYGCAAAAVAAGVVILDGFEPTDLLLPNGETSDEWKNSRLGRSLSSIFAAQTAAAVTSRKNKVLLILCVNEEQVGTNQQQAVIHTTKALFSEVMETKKLLLTKKKATEEEEGTLEDMSNLPTFEDLYDVMLVPVQSEEAAKKVTKFNLRRKSIVSIIILISTPSLPSPFFYSPPRLWQFPIKMRQRERH